MKKWIIAVIIILVLIAVSLAFSFRPVPQSALVGPSLDAAKQTERATTTPPASLGATTSVAVKEALASGVTASKVVIKSCAPNPKVIKIARGETVVFKNSDEKAHNIFFDPKHIFGLAALSETKITFDFWSKLGIRNYTCDGAAAGTVAMLDSSGI